MGSSVLLPEPPPDSIKKPTEASAKIATMVKQLPSEESLRAMMVSAISGSANQSPSWFRMMSGCVGAEDVAHTSCMPRQPAGGGEPPTSRVTRAAQTNLT